MNTIMLSQQFSNQQNLNLKNYITHYGLLIQNEDEHKLLLQVVFRKSQRVKCIPFEFVPTEFEHVDRAIIHLNSIANELKICTFSDPHAIHLRNHLTHILGCLRFAYNKYACKQDTTYRVSVTAEQMHTMADQVLLLCS